MATQEDIRLANDAAGRADWRLWGTYLAERQWSTVREDYSPDGDAWGAFPYDMSRLRAYRWGEDGLLGWTDSEGRLCFSVALWNGRDTHLKEKLFGLSNTQGNHGEDVKEFYYYVDATPTGSYARALYKYPQAGFPYDELVAENGHRGFDQPEYELLDTGLFDADRYFDVAVEYAKCGPEDMLVRITASNRGPDTADLALLPTLTFRNDWSWAPPAEGGAPRRRLRDAPDEAGPGIAAEHATLGRYRLAAVRDSHGICDTVFTGNDTNTDALGCSGCCSASWTRSNSCRPTASAACPSCTRTTRSAWNTGARAIPSTTCPARATAARSEATATGADRSGFQSTSCWCMPCSARTRCMAKR